MEGGKNATAAKEEEEEEEERDRKALIFFSRRPSERESRRPLPTPSQTISASRREREREKEREEKGRKVISSLCSAADASERFGATFSLFSGKKRRRGGRKMDRGRQRARANGKLLTDLPYQ